MGKVQGLCRGAKEEPGSGDASIDRHIGQEWLLNNILAWLSGKDHCHSEISEPV